MKVASFSVTRRVCLFGLTAGAFLLAGGQGQAQSIYGPGGLFLNPTADFPRPGKLTPSILVIPQNGRAANRDRTATSFIADYGVTDRLEAGLIHHRISGPGEDPSTGGFVKYKLLEGNTNWRPDVAVGATILGGGTDDARTAFVALRFTPPRSDLDHPLHLHTGLLYADKLGGVRRRRAVPYVGIDYAVCSQITLFAEIRARMRSTIAPNEADATAPNAVGFVWKPKADYKIAIAYANNGWNSRGNRLSIGVGYSFGGRRQ